MRTLKRSLALLLVVILLLALTPVSEAKTGTLSVNTGTRHTLCTALSAQAQAYYTGSYAFETVRKLSASRSDPMHSDMFARLHTLMDTTMTTSVNYSSLTSYWPKTDANNGSSNPVLFYSDELSAGFNREHVWPKSRASFKQSCGGSDLHHLRPTNERVNSTRGNMTMGNVKGVLSSYKTYAYGGKTVLWYSTAADLVEVNDNIKGDVAHILLYVWCRWEEPNLYENDPNPTVGPDDDANDGRKVIESLDTLLQWMAADPVDTWEMSRNDQCENVQGNRNVFIDYPEYAWLLFEKEPPANYSTPSGGSAPSPTATATATATASGKPTPTATASGKPTPTATASGKPTPRPTPTEIPEEGDYVIRIDGGDVSAHTEQIDGADGLKVDVFIDGVTPQRMLSSLSYFDLAYDVGQLSFVRYSAKHGTMNVVNCDESTQPGLVRYAFASTNGTLIDSDTPLITFFFRLSDTLKDGDEIAFAFCGEMTADSLDGSSYRTEKRTVGAKLHPYRFSTVLYGDADCDGCVTAADASLVLRALVGLSTISEQGRRNAHVGSGTALCAEDARLILQYVAKLIEHFPVQE